MIKRKGYYGSGLAERLKELQRNFEAKDDEIHRLLELYSLDQQRYLIGYDPGFDDLSNATLYAVTKDNTMETDDQLRARLIYIGVPARQLASMELDRIAEEYGLKRRKIDRESTQPIQREYKMDDRTWTRQYPGEFK